MGADVHIYAEYRNTANAWEAIPDYEPFGQRSYDVFHFLPTSVFQMNIAG